MAGSCLESVLALVFLGKAILIGCRSGAGGCRWGSGDRVIGAGVGIVCFWGK